MRRWYFYLGFHGSVRSGSPTYIVVALCIIVNLTNRVRVLTSWFRECRLTTVGGTKVGFRLGRRVSKKWIVNDKEGGISGDSKV